MCSTIFLRFASCLVFSHSEPPCYLSLSLWLALYFFTKSNPALAAFVNSGSMCNDNRIKSNSHKCDTVHCMKQNACTSTSASFSLTELHTVTLHFHKHGWICPNGILESTMSLQTDTIERLRSLLSSL